MNTAQRLSWVAVGLCMVAAVLMPLNNRWVTIGLIVPALALMAIGLGYIQRDRADVDEAAALQAKWRFQRERCR